VVNFQDHSPTQTGELWRPGLAGKIEAVRAAGDAEQRMFERNAIFHGSCNKGRFFIRPTTTGSLATPVQIEPTDIAADESRSLVHRFVAASGGTLAFDTRRSRMASR